MRIIYNDAGDFKNIRTAVALGNFDGVHIGHMSLIKKIKEYDDLASCVWTFTEHTLNILKGGRHVAHITGKDEKAEIFRRENIDYLVFQDFSYIRHMQPEAFVDEVLVGYLNARAVVCGFDYRFGRDGAGDAALLKKLLAARNITGVVMPPVVCDGQVVSSSAIRELIQAGDIGRAEKFLGRPFRREK